MILSHFNEYDLMYYFSTSVTILVHITMWKEGAERTLLPCERRRESGNLESGEQ